MMVLVVRQMHGQWRLFGRQLTATVIPWI